MHRCLVNLWSVHTCALQDAYAIGTYACVVCLLAPRPQYRNTILQDPRRRRTRLPNSSSFLASIVLCSAKKICIRKRWSEKSFLKAKKSWGRRRGTRRGGLSAEKLGPQSAPCAPTLWCRVGNVSSSATNATIMRDPRIHNLDRHIPEPDAQSHRGRARKWELEILDLLSHADPKRSKVGFYLASSFFPLSTTTIVSSLSASNNFMWQSNGARGESKRYIVDDFRLKNSPRVLISCKVKNYGE